MRDGRSYTYHILLAIITLGAYLITCGGFLPRLWTATPILLLPLVTVIAMYESKWATFAYSLAAGLLMDCSSRRFVCFNTVFFVLLGITACLCVELMFNNILRTAAVMSAVGCVSYYLLYWIIFLIGGGDAIGLLVRFAAIGAAYSWLFTLPIYYLVRRLSLRERREARL